ncbi:MAG TPA: DUF1622 domain-containing protein [Gemmatimonadaceae bacterium]|nr:DUF1622 domain-containing protein [Gemmatimonadaceae bacterium]
MPSSLTAIQFARAVEWLVRAIEIGGIAIIVVGALVATGLFALHLARGHAFDGAYHDYRLNLGRAILLGLEFLVAADIIGTVAVDPTFTSLGVLALIVVIRTFLSFSLEVEINGRWPWAAGAREASAVDRASGEPPRGPRPVG